MRESARNISIAAIVLLLAGCGSNSPMAGPPEKVTGATVTMHTQPLHPVSYELDAAKARELHRLISSGTEFDGDRAVVFLGTVTLRYAGGKSQLIGLYSDHSIITIREDKNAVDVKVNAAALERLFPELNAPVFAPAAATVPAAR